MIIKDVVADALLALAVLVVAASSLGVLVMSDAYRKLHFLGPATLVAPLLVALAVLVQEGYSQNTTQTWLALLFVVVAAPFVSHATIRAARCRQEGDWRQPCQAPGEPRQAPGEARAASEAGAAGEAETACEPSREERSP